MDKTRIKKKKKKIFILTNEVYPVSPLNHHPEYELVLILNGKGKRMVGDNVDRFKENDLVFTGPFLPHQWICDTYQKSQPDVHQMKAFVIQFAYDFLGDKFFEIPENASLKKFLIESTRGYEFDGHAKKQIISLLSKMINSNDVERLFDLFSIFKMFASSREFHLLSSPHSIESFLLKENEVMQKALQYILRNFHDRIRIKDLLEITNMSYPSFYSHFMSSYKMSFKKYLLDVRIDYACKLLKDENQNIAEIAYSCGFENLSNFNRQFRRSKNLTPSQFRKQLISRELV